MGINIFLFKILKRLQLCLLVPFLLSTGGCTKNILETIADKNSDAALYEAARKDLDNESYSSAITNIGLMSTGRQADNDVQKLLGSAYAGRCGFNFINFFTNLSSADFSSINFFTFTMQAFNGKAVAPDDCATAVQIFNTAYPDLASRPTDVALMMMLLGLAKMGTYIHNKADVDGTDNLGDGLVDSSFNSCSDFTDDEVGEITTGIGIFLTNFAAVGASLFGENSTGNVETFTSGCNLLTGGTLNPDQTVTGGACTKTDADEVTDNERAAMRAILHSDSMGLGNCNEANAALVPLCCP
ncbi:MAG: hypothetical protein AB7O96_14690 [Pseudobdellovibrionaceae bacterium]